MVAMHIRGSDWITNFLLLDGKTFSLEHYPFYREVYDQMQYDATLLITGRQVAKSTTLSNLLCKNICLMPYWKSLFISPSQEQTARFSQTRFGKVLMHSPRLKGRWVTPDLSSRVFLKQLKNGSEVALSYASDNADRVRGISADEVMYDEVQDIDYDAVVPVISEVLSNSDYRREYFCGTPKTMENTIERLWKWSTQTEWAVRCGGCNRFNILNTDKCLGKRGPICTHCGDYLNVRQGIWVDTRTYPNDYDGKKIKGFHISQPMLPRNVPASMPSDYKSQELALKRWGKILEKYTTYPTSKFKNEVMGVSDSTGSRLITRAELEAFCTDYVISDMPPTSQRFDAIVAGVDWSGGGTGGNSLTVLWIWGVTRSNDLHRMRLTTLYSKIYPENNPISGGIIDDIIMRCNHFNVDLVFGDAGGGALANDYLRTALGGRARQVQYRAVMSSSSGKPQFYWNKQDRYMAERTTMIDHFLVFVKNGGARYACLPQMEEAFRHMLSVYEDASNNGQKIWKRTAGEPDDALHAQVFGWIAANVVIGNPMFTKEIA
jgi:hypothetical protein